MQKKLQNKRCKIPGCGLLVAPDAFSQKVHQDLHDNQLDLVTEVKEEGKDERQI